MKRQRAAAEDVGRCISPAIMTTVGKQVCDEDGMPSSSPPSLPVVGAATEGAEELQTFIHVGSPRFLLQAAIFCLHGSAPLNSYRFLMAGLAAMGCRDVPKVVDGHDMVKYMRLISKNICTELEKRRHGAVVPAADMAGMLSTSMPACQSESEGDASSILFLERLLSTSIEASCTSSTARKHCVATALAAVTPTAADAWTSLGLEARLSTFTLAEAKKQHLGAVATMLRASHDAPEMLVVALGVLAQIIICYRPLGLESDLVKSNRVTGVILSLLVSGGSGRSADVSMASAWLIHALVCTNSSRVHDLLVDDHDLLEKLSYVLAASNMRADIRALAACTFRVVLRASGNRELNVCTVTRASCVLPCLARMLRASSEIVQISAAYAIAAFPFGAKAGNRADADADADARGQNVMAVTMLQSCLDDLLDMLVAVVAADGDKGTAVPVRAAVANALYTIVCSSASTPYKTSVGRRALPTLVTLLWREMDSMPLAVRDAALGSSLVLLLCSLCDGHRANTDIFTQTSQALPLVSRMLQCTHMPHVQKGAAKLVRLLFFSSEAAQCGLTLHGVVGQCILLAESSQASVQDNACLTLQYITHGKRVRDQAAFPAFVHALVYCGANDVLCRIIIQSPCPDMSGMGGSSDFARARAVSVLQNMSWADGGVVAVQIRGSSVLLAHLSLMAHKSFGHDVQSDALALLQKAIGRDDRERTTLENVLGILPNVEFLHSDDRCGICLNGSSDSGGTDNDGKEITSTCRSPIVVCTPCCKQRLHRACLGRWVYEKDQDTCPLCRRVFTQAILSYWKALSV